MSTDSEQYWRPAMVTSFRGSQLPEPAVLAGFSALIDRYDLSIPLPPVLSAIGTRRNPKSSDAWQLLTSRQSVPQNLGDHLEFALKNEGVNLSVLKSLFSKLPKSAMESWIGKTPGGANTRRVWFLYEWLTEHKLDVPPVPKIRAVPVIDRAKQFGLDGGDRSARHSVVDNLPGTRDFCPLVRRTPKLDAFEARGFDRLAREVVGRTHRDVIARAAAFLVLKDSKSSFFIESEKPTYKLAARWARAIAEAGLHVLTIEELERLQRIVLADTRFVHPGLRKIGGFVGVHDRVTREPLPDHICARWQDLQTLMGGLVAYSNRAKVGKVDAVTTAAAIAFGFVYIHPFEDGNGRIHRWLFHHVLSTAQYNPPGIVFPISATILTRIDEYRKVLESYSKPLLEFIEWRPTKDGNIDVVNDTLDYYRYFDATLHAEFLCECVQQTVEHDLPEEVAYLEAFDAFSTQVLGIVDMPNRTLDLLHRFLSQNKGTLSQRARSEEFAQLTDQEAVEIEKLHAHAFANVVRLPEEDSVSARDLEERDAAGKG
jgi:hypothetical protein